MEHETPTFKLMLCVRCWHVAEKFEIIVFELTENFASAHQSHKVKCKLLLKSTLIWRFESILCAHHIMSLVPWSLLQLRTETKR